MAKIIPDLPQFHPQIDRAVPVKINYAGPLRIFRHYPPDFADYFPVIPGRSMPGCPALLASTLSDFSSASGQRKGPCQRQRPENRDRAG
jgi:hypothetical protein